MAFLTKTYHLFLTSIFFLLLLNSFFNLSNCQSNSPQNIETFYPFPEAPAPEPVVSPAVPPSNPPVVFSPPTSPPLPTPPPPSVTVSPSGSTSHKAIYTAVGVTAASTLVVAAAVFFLCTRYAKQRRKEIGGGTVHAVGAIGAAGGGGGGGGGSGGRLQPLAQSEFTRFDGNIKGLIVDEDGLDVLYWRKLEGSQRKSGPFHKDVFSKASNNGRRTYSRGKSSSSNQIHAHSKEDQSARLLDPKPALPNEDNFQAIGNVREPEKLVVAKEQISLAPAPPPPRPPVPVKAGPAPPPPPPTPPMADKKGPAPPPPPPPMAVKKGPAPPPPPLKGGGSSKPPQAPKRTPSGNIVEALAIGDEASESKNDQVKLRPLHWEKVNVNTDHSMVWDKIERGSFQYNGDMMEALFGYVAANRKSPKEESSAAQSKATPNAGAAKIFILDSWRSQNIAIVIRSLGVTRNELIEGLQEGKGLNVEILEKLTRITPSREEKIEILGFNGDATRLADAESFLYHLLKAVPSAFTRVNTMLFRYTYGSEINQLKESLQTLDSACTELRNRGVFLKLLEAILKAGNRLNAGTARGDAKAFNLTALRKLSDYKSSDGKTTLLHFVVHEVVRNEGRRCVMNRNNSLTRTNSQRNSSSNPKPEESKSKEEQEREFLQLGLPVVGGLSAEFSNVKKAAGLDYDTIMSISTATGARLAETRQLVLQCGADDEGREFIKEMKEFLAAAEGEIKVVQEEQARVMEFVMKTTQYYQAGGFKDKQPLQLFIIVKDFLAMVDQACIEIARSLQQKKGNTAGAAGSSSSSPSSPSTPDVLRTRVTFPRLPRNFLSDKSSGSDSDDDS